MSKPEHPENQHQAKLMPSSNGSDNSGQDDSPAPILPNIVAPPAGDSHFKPSKATNQSNDVDKPADPAPTASTESVTPTQPSADESTTQQIMNNLKPSQPNTRKVLTGLTVTLVGLLGLSAVWYNLNQDVYTLNGQGDLVATNPTEMSPTPSSQPSTLGAEDSQSNFEFTFNNLPSLQQGFYQMWLQDGDQTTSLGAFNVQDGQAIGHQSDQPFQPDISQVDTGNKLIVTIQAGDEPASSPSSTIILSGEWSNNGAELAFTAIDFSQAKGKYTIAAPSDLSGENQNAGIWFATTDGKSLTGPGLDIPVAPAGWAYEGQVVYKDIAITTGRFSQPNQSDNFYGFTPNPDELPSNFPGEDYLINPPSSLDLDFPANLTNGQWKIIISLEPDQDGQDPTGDDTFTIQPFSATIADGAKTYEEYNLNRDLSTLPKGSIVRK